MKPVNASVLAVFLATASVAQSPLTAIDWLGDPVSVPIAKPRTTPPNEPPVANVVVMPQVKVHPLDAAIPDAVGLLPSSSTGLPKSLWQASKADDLIGLFSNHTREPLPAIQALYYTLLMAEADAPLDASTDGKFLKARTQALIDFGAVEPALALIERAGPSTIHLFDQWLDLSLLSGHEDRACQKLGADPSLTRNYAARIYCIARTGDWQTAALTYNTATAINALPLVEAELLAQFLDPETISAPPPSISNHALTPLLFRLYESVGSPLSTRGLPRAYAMADLRKTAGWKAEIEAAERLTRTGALPATRLFGLYTERTPAASGGVWERVAAVHALDSALNKNNAGDIAIALPNAWSAFQSQGLEIAFAQLFADRLQVSNLPYPARNLSFEVALLSPDYEAAITILSANTSRQKFLTGLAAGTPPYSLASTALEKAIATAFTTTAASSQHQPLLDQGKLGQAILVATNQIDHAGVTDTVDITSALSTLRAIGLEDTARRAALQLLILKDAR